jgi:hypothetical protein
MSGDNHGGPSFRVPEKLSGRAVFGIIGVSLVVVATIASDQAVYSGPPKTFLQRMIAIPHALLFPLFNERFSTNFAVAIVLAAVFLAFGGLAWVLLQRYVLEPWYIRNAVMRTEREERWFNIFRKH